MTNHWSDFANTKCVLVVGGNPAENHPSVMQYINEARSNGAKLVVVDPRRTRLAALADVFVRVRPGTDIAFINGLMNYAITNNKVDTTFLTSYTDAIYKVDSDGDYKRSNKTPPAATTAPTTGGLDDSDSVYTALKNRVAGYTIAEVANITGASTTSIEQAYSMYCNNKPGTLTYAMGGTQHTYGSQQIRSYAMVQTLLGNMGIKGGGVNALRGIHNVQGSTDMGLLQGLVPGYAAVPSADVSTTLAADALTGATEITVANAGSIYVGNVLRLNKGGVNEEDVTVLAKSGNILTVSALAKDHSSGETVWKSTYGDYMDKLFGPGKGVGPAYWSGLQQVGTKNLFHHYFHQTADPDLAQSMNGESNSNWDLFPKGGGLHHRAMFDAARAGTLKGMVVYGQNPAVSEPNTLDIKAGLQNLDWLVVVDPFESETAACDRKANVGTNVGVTWLLPASTFAEETGSITNSGRWIQWRYKAIDPAGNGPSATTGPKTDLEIIMTLARELITQDAMNRGSLTQADFWTATWADSAQSGYGWDGTSAFNQVTVAENVYKQMCSQRTTSNEYGALWIYKGAYNPLSSGYFGSEAGKWSSDAADGILAKSRSNYDPAGNKLYPRWAWAWLLNRRVFYNQLPAPGTGSCSGRPTDSFASGYVTYCDKTTGSCPSKAACPTRSQADVNDVFVPCDKKARFWLNTWKGWERAVAYAAVYRAYSTLSDTWTAGSQTGTADWKFPKHWEPRETPRTDLVATYGQTGIDPVDAPGSVSDYPLVLTTFRVTEHFQAGQTTRNSPWLCELVPEPIIEINSADAYTYSIKTGDPVYIDTIRGSDIGPFRAVVGTGLQTNQRVKKGVVAVPWHWGNKGLSTGPSANDCCIDALDANAYMPETKVCLCRIHT